MYLEREWDICRERESEEEDRDRQTDRQTDRQEKVTERE